MKQLFLGLDPGYERTGYALILAEAKKYSLQDVGVIKTSKTLSFPERLLSLQNDLSALIQHQAIHSCAIEKIFFSSNVKTAIPVAMARGVLLVTLTSRKIAIAEYSPSQIKKAITGSGTADKKAIQLMLTRLLGLSEKILQDDAADAVAMALTHAMIPDKLRIVL